MPHDQRAVRPAAPEEKAGRPSPHRLRHDGEHSALLHQTRMTLRTRPARIDQAVKALAREAKTETTAAELVAQILIEQAAATLWRHGAEAGFDDICDQVAAEVFENGHELEGGS